jgi:hypothetical protein
MQVLLGPQEERTQRRVIGWSFVDDELGLTARAFQRHDGNARDARGGFRPEVASHKVETQIKTCGGSGGRQYPAVVDVEDLWVNGDGWVASCQLTDDEPMRRR